MNTNILSLKKKFSVTKGFFFSKNAMISLDIMIKSLKVNIFSLTFIHQEKYSKTKLTWDFSYSIINISIIKKTLNKIIEDANMKFETFSLGL